MYHFKTQIANQICEIECIHEQTSAMCRDYLTDSPACTIAVKTTAEDIEYERQRETDTRHKDEDSPVAFSDAYLETLSVYRKLSTAMIDHDTLLIHGAVIAVENKAYIFLAKSGVGKTTHIKNWRRMIPGSYVVNGDKPLINARSMIAYGTPWCGKENLHTNTAVPLAGICILDRGEENRIEEISFREAFPKLLQQTFRPEDPVKTAKVLELLEQFKKIPCYHLCCTKEPESAVVSYQKMNGEG